MIKRCGPSTLPWGTTDVTTTSLEKQPSTSTVAFDRWEMIERALGDCCQNQIIYVMVTPASETESKAFFTSKYTVRQSWVVSWAAWTLSKSKIS